MLSSDIKTYLSLTQTRDASNGGRRSNTIVQHSAVAQVFPYISRSERKNSTFIYRKLATVIEDLVDDGALRNTLDLIDRPTLGDDAVSMFAGTPTDTQGDIPGSDTGADTKPKFGAAYLAADITSGDQTVVVDVELAKFASGVEAFFLAGRQVRVTDMVTADSATEREDFVTIDAVTSVVGLRVTFTTLEQIGHDYTAGDGESRAISMIDHGNVECSTENYVVTAAGDYAYNHVTYPLITDGSGTIEDSLTLEWSGANNFSCVGSSGTDYGSGTFGADFTPMNSAKSRKYFTLEAAGHSGTPQAGDTITIDIHSAEYNTWYKLEVPVDCQSLANNKVTKVAIGESDQ